MKHQLSKILSLLLAALLILGCLAACNQTSEPDVTTSPEDTSSQDTSSQDTAETDNVQPPTEEALDESAAALLDSALTAAGSKTNYESIQHQTLGYDSTTLTDITVSYATATDGKDHRITANVMGTEVSYLLIGDTAYVTMPVATGNGKYTVTLTEEQKQSLLSGASSEDAIDFSKILSAEAFVGLSGIQHTDGSATLTANDLSDAAKTALGAGEGLEVSLSSCTLEMNTDGLITKLAISYTLTMLETDFTAAFTMNGLASVVTSYENVSLTAPEDAADYLAESYVAVFEGSVPLESMMQAGKMPLTEGNYVIGDASTGANATAQAALLSRFPHLYANKSFTVSGKVSTDGLRLYMDIDGTPVALDFPQGIFAPIAGDVISIEATFAYGSSGSEADLSNYFFHFATYDLIERAAAPNGGTYMYVNVDALNVRTQPTTSGNSPIGVLNQGEVVEVLAILDGWAKIVYEKSELGYAYASAKYLTES